MNENIKFGSTKAYIAGPITGVKDFAQRFEKVQKDLEHKGWRVMNPATLPHGFSWDEYMQVCIPMLNVCDTVIFLEGWEGSRGATVEMQHARKNKKRIFFYKDGKYSLK